MQQPIDTRPGSPEHAVTAMALGVARAIAQTPPEELADALSEPPASAAEQRELPLGPIEAKPVLPRYGRH